MLFQSNVVGLCLNDIVVLVFDEAVNSKILSVGFKNLLDNLLGDLKLKKGVNLLIGVGSINEGMDKLYLSYKEAKRLSVAKQIKSNISKSKVHKNIEKEDSIIETNNILCGKIINEDLNVAIIEFNTILNNLIIKSEGHDFLVIKEMLLGVFNPKLF